MGRPYPDHTSIPKTFEDTIRVYGGYSAAGSIMGMKQSSWTKGMLAADSTGVETDVCDKKIRPVKSKKKFEKVRVKRFLKWHKVAYSCHTFCT